MLHLIVRINNPCTSLVIANGIITIHDERAIRTDCDSADNAVSRMCGLVEDVPFNTDTNPIVLATTSDRVRIISLICIKHRLTGTEPLCLLLSFDL